VVPQSADVAADLLHYLIYIPWARAVSSGSILLTRLLLPGAAICVPGRPTFMSPLAAVRQG
jgi:hypothetical protein